MKLAPISRRSLLLLVVGGFDAACSSDANFGGWGVGGIGGGAGSSADGAAGGPDATGNLVTGVRVFSGGTATLLFNGPSCTHEGDATGDRWCGFVTFTDATMQARSLYVFNASRAAAGADVRCDNAATGNADCLLLTADLGGDGGTPVLHGTFFGGDTLVYYDHGLAPYAWRPGMTKGRLLATFAPGEDAVLCTPAPRGTAVLCVLLPVVEPDLNPTAGLATLLIGKADGATEPLLSAADDVVVWSAADAGFRPTFSFGFPPGPGDHVAWTTRDGATGPETLRLQRAGDAASKVTIASDVHDWDVTPDAAHWFWLAGTQGTGLGTLQTAPFPAGTNPTDVRGEVSDYSIAPSDGKTIVAVTRDRALIAIANPIAATTEVALDTGVEMVLSLSDAGHVAYSKKRLATNSGDLYVKKIDGAGTCVAETTRPVPFRSVSFVGGAILWAHSYTDGFEAHYTRLGDCNTMPVATDITLLESVGHARVLFMDTFDDVSVSGTLRVRLVGSDNTLTGATVPIADHVDSYAIAGPAPDMLLYTVNARGENDGVYVRAFAD